MILLGLLILTPRILLRRRARVSPVAAGALPPARFRRRRVDVEFLVLICDVLVRLPAGPGALIAGVGGQGGAGAGEEGGEGAAEGWERHFGRVGLMGVDWL